MLFRAVGAVRLILAIFLFANCELLTDYHASFTAGPHTPKAPEMPD